MRHAVGANVNFFGRSTREGPQAVVGVRLAGAKSQPREPDGGLERHLSKKRNSFNGARPEPRSQTNVGAALLEGFQGAHHVPGVHLAVGIESPDPLSAAGQRVSDSGLQRRALPEVDRMTEKVDGKAGEHLRRGVRRTVVDRDDVQRPRQEAFENVAHDGRFVENGNDDPSGAGRGTLFDHAPYYRPRDLMEREKAAEISLPRWADSPVFWSCLLFVLAWTLRMLALYYMDPHSLGHDESFYISTAKHYAIAAGRSFSNKFYMPGWPWILSWFARINTSVFFPSRHCPRPSELHHGRSPLSPGPKGLHGTDRANRGARDGGVPGPSARFGHDVCGTGDRMRCTVAVTLYAFGQRPWKDFP